MEDHSQRALDAARKLRRKMTLPEGLLWQRLRSRPAGFKFRNQHPIGNLVVDFYCAQARLILEIDGIVHSMGSNPGRDAERDRWLRSQGFEVVRFLASDVLKDPDAVAETVVSLCNAAPPPSALRAATSPRGGASFGAPC